MLQQVMDHLSANEAAHLEELADYVRIPSVGSNGPAMLAAARHIEQMLARAGLRTRMLDPGHGAYPIVVGEKEGRVPGTVIFYNHYDIADYTNPLELDGDEVPVRITDDRMYGRGVADDKGCTVSRIHAVAAWLQTAGELPIGVRFVIVGKQSASDGVVHRYIAEHPELTQGDAVIWETGAKTADERPTMSLGAKGYLYVDLIAKGAKRDTPSRFTIFPNPAWRLVEALGTLWDGEKVLLPGFYDDVRPLSGRDRELLEAAYNDEFEAVRQREGFARFIGDKDGLALMEQLYVTPTLTLCGLLSGSTSPGEEHLVLPGQAMAKLEFRLVPDQDPDRVLASLRDHLQRHGFGDLELNVLGDGRPFRSPPDDPMVEAAVRAAGRVYDKPPLIRITSIGMSAKWAFAPLPNIGVGVEYWGAQLETPEEHLRRRDYTEGAQYIAALLHEIAAVKEAQT